MRIVKKWFTMDIGEPKTFNVNRSFYFILRNKDNMAVFLDEIKYFEY